MKKHTYIAVASVSVTTDWNNCDNSVSGDWGILKLDIQKAIENKNKKNRKILFFYVMKKKYFCCFCIWWIRSMYVNQRLFSILLFININIGLNWCIKKLEKRTFF